MPRLHPEIESVAALSRPSGFPRRKKRPRLLLICSPISAHPPPTQTDLSQPDLSQPDLSYVISHRPTRDLVLPHQGRRRLLQGIWYSGTPRLGREDTSDPPFRPSPPIPGCAACEGCVAVRTMSLINLCKVRRQQAAPSRAHLASHAPVSVSQGLRSSMSGPSFAIVQHITYTCRYYPPSHLLAMAYPRPGLRRANRGFLRHTQRRQALPIQAALLFRDSSNRQLSCVAATASGPRGTSSWNPLLLHPPNWLSLSIRQP